MKNCEWDAIFTIYVYNQFLSTFSYKSHIFLNFYLKRYDFIFYLFPESGERYLFKYLSPDSGKI